MKKRKNIIIVIISVLVVIVSAVVLFNILNDKDKLTVVERNWINDNIGTILNINVLNNANVFGKDGSGVYYDFLNDFKDEYSLSINPITFNSGNNPSGITLGVKYNVDSKDKVIYKDHFVLVSKNNDVISTISDLNGKEIGVVGSDLSYVTKYIKTNATFKQYETKDELVKEMKDSLSYMLVPLTDYLDIILSNDYYVVYHFSDIKIYYVLELDNSTLASVLRKYYSKWEGSFKEKYNDNLFKAFTSAMNITDTEVDAMQSVSYNYGFVNASPYEVILGGKYGGIVAVYLSKFSDFADVEFNFVKYKNFDKFNKAVSKGEIDLYFNYYNFKDDYYQTDGLPIEYVAVAPKDDNIVIKSLNSLIGEEVYVLNNSKIYDYVNGISGITIKTYNTTKDLLKLNKKDVYIILDKNTFDYYSDKKLDNYSARYEGFINNEYTFKVKNNSALYKLLDKYIGVMDENEMVLEGLLNHEETIKSGNLITKIAEYILYVVIIVAVVIIVFIKKSKKVSIAKKIKKDDKMKFIDQLTSLKNRNFLNENIETWNNNTIYPQTIIVIDLNKVQEINDSYGYNEGDRQIKALANILVKTQLDNSEILRTDGNEFVIYLVGYNQKQVSNYIHKLNKEIKKLPYDFGAEFGFSMILDDIKTIEDALNEAIEDMKKNKENNNDEGKA